LSRSKTNQFAAFETRQVAVDQIEKTSPDLHELIGLFYESSNELGEFQPVDSQSMEPDYRQLLAHDHHMTISVEEFHRCPVNLEVLDENVVDDLYSRKILLRRTTDNQVVQFGIVRLSLDILTPQVREKIESKSLPMGRVLIEHNVLRTVRLTQLWQISPGSELSSYFWSEPQPHCYGRTAMIFFDDQPAIELLEIVAC